MLAEDRGKGTGDRLVVQGDTDFARGGGFKGLEG